MTTFREVDRTETVTITTRVVYTLNDGTEKEVLVPHFNPKSEADITRGLENRAVTEQRQYDEEQAG